MRDFKIISNVDEEVELKAQENGDIGLGVLESLNKLKNKKRDVSKKWY